MERILVLHVEKIGLDGKIDGNMERILVLHAEIIGLDDIFKFLTAIWNLRKRLV
jgi:hypothetical protein